MKMKIELLIDTDEAEPDEMVQAIKTALEVLEMPNGDTLYLGEQDVSLVSVVPNVKVRGE